MPDLSRRRLLKFIGVAPAIPLITKISPAEVEPIPEPIPVRNTSVMVSGGALVASGGWCAPPDPAYDFYGIASDSRPVRDSLPTIRARR